MATVEFEHAEKTYPNGTRALIDCTLRVTDGELLVLVGPSGCGKSTLLRLLAGLETLTSGTIRIGDQIVNDMAPQQRNVAMVFQDYALYPHMTARANLEFPLKMRRMPRPERNQRVETTARILEIEALLERLPKQLSGGQRQRVAMGRALVREPKVFLLDEPLSNLDAKLRVQVRAEIKDLQQRLGATMLYVTHDQVEAMTLGDRVAVLDKGELQQVAAPGVLYDAPANTFVAGFIGNPPMNLFSTELASDRSGTPAIRLGAHLVRIDPGHAEIPSSAGLTAGVRPEAIHLVDGSDGIHAVVEYVEHLGHETLAHLSIDGAAHLELVARFPGMHPFAKDQSVAIRIDPDRIHLFGADGRRRQVAAVRSQISEPRSEKGTADERR